MPLEPPVEEPSHYLVRARPPSTLAPLIAHLETNRAGTIVRRMGPAHDPHTLLISTTREQAADLAQRFAGTIIVEPDRPLSLYQEAQPDP
jgi:hypothetical protein